MAASTVRLTRRGRIVLVAIAAFLLLGVFWIGTHQAGTASAGRGGHAVVDGLPWVMVHEGDTLWDIATAVSPESDANATVRQIMQLNGLERPIIRPGMRIYVPGG